MLKRAHLKAMSTFAIHWHNESCHIDGYQTTDVAKW